MDWPTTFSLFLTAPLPPTSPHCPPYPLRLCGPSLSPHPLIHNQIPLTPLSFHCTFLAKPWPWLNLPLPAVSPTARPGAAAWSLISFSQLQGGPQCLPGILSSFSDTSSSPTLRDNDFKFSPPSSNLQPSSPILTLSWWPCFLFHWENKSNLWVELHKFPPCLPTYTWATLDSCAPPLLWAAPS